MASAKNTRENMSLKILTSMHLLLSMLRRWLRRQQIGQPAFHVILLKKRASIINLIIYSGRKLF